MDKFDIRNAETQTYCRDLTRDIGSQVGMTLSMLQQKAEVHQPQSVPYFISPYPGPQFAPVIPTNPFTNLTDLLHA